jgi:hypothetical protein
MTPLIGWVLEAVTDRSLELFLSSHGKVSSCELAVCFY